MFCGINLSGHMTPIRVSCDAEILRSHAKAKGQPLLDCSSIPAAAPKEDCMNPALGGFVDFYTSPYRAREGETIRKLRRVARLASGDGGCCHAWRDNNLPAPFTGFLVQIPVHT